MVYDVEDVLAATRNRGGQLLELVAVYDRDGVRNTRFVLRISDPDSDPVEFMPSQEALSEMGILLLGLASFTDHNLYVDRQTIDGWADQMYLILRCLGLVTANEFANKTVKVGAKNMRMGDVGKPVKKELNKMGKDLRGPPPIEES